MTSPRPETTDRTELIEDKDKDKPQGAQLSATQVAAGALAAVSSAVVASFFGLAGTLIGAALASVISTVSAALYSNSLQKTNERLRRARGSLTGRQAPVEQASATPTTASAATPATQVLPAHLDPRRAPARRSRPRWTRVAVYAAAVFVMAMGVITGIELIGQKPVAALVGGTETSQGTTIGAVTNASSSSPVEEQEDDPSSPATSAPATGTSEPSTGADEGSASDEDSESDESGSATPTRTSEAEPTTSSQPTTSSPRTSSEESSRGSSSAGAGAGAGAGAQPTS
jgi:hypothetical protein